MSNSSAPATPGHAHHKAFWLWVMCLTGVDYFSTLGYQPSIAFDNAGVLAPLATIVLVAVTLLGALPIYSYVARESPHGQGSIAMLEHLLFGWWSKGVVLVLLGFAATDFVITKTLSAADAAEHIVHNSLWMQYASSFTGEAAQMYLTMGLLVLLGGVFMRGFREVIYVAVALVGIYLFLNVIIIGSGLFYIVFIEPQLITNWWANVTSGNWHVEHVPLYDLSQPAGDRPAPPLSLIAVVCILIFPKLALGLSGFETGVAVMPLVAGDEGDDPIKPAGRIRNTRKLLLTAAVIMSVLLLGSSFVVSMLINPADLKHPHRLKTLQQCPTCGEMVPVERRSHPHVRPAGHATASLAPDEQPGKAANRALAFLAHHEDDSRTINPLFGPLFGTIYDISTVLILWFAGASAMSGLLNLVPQYLPRYGMAPEWAKAIRPLVLLLTVINLLVTWYFNASVEAQGGAYATGVLVLMSSASIAAVIDVYRKRQGWWFVRVPWGMTLVAGVFLYTMVAVVIEKPEGLRIASFFIVAIIAVSLFSRIMRSTELRLDHFDFVNQESKFLWDSLKHLEIPVLVPHRPGRRDLTDKEEDIRRVHRLEAGVPIVYIEAAPGDVSEFSFTPLMAVISEEGRFIIRVTRCASIAHVIAAVGLEIGKGGHPPEIHFGWSDEMPLAANLKFVLFGEGNVPWMVRELIEKNEPDPKYQPRIVIG